MKKFLSLNVGFWILLSLFPVGADTIDDLKKDLALVQAEIRAEFALLRAAHSDIDRIKVIGPRLWAREKELIEEIQAAEKKQAEKR